MRARSATGAGEGASGGVVRAGDVAVGAEGLGLDQQLEHVDTMGPSMSEVTAQVCPTHGVETRLNCAECGRPICLRCQVRTEVGLKCTECAALSPRAAAAAAAVAGGRRRLVRAAVAAAAGGALLVAVVVLLSSRSATPQPGAPLSAPVGRWVSEPDLTALRGGTTAVLLRDGRVLAVGGGIGAIPLAATEIFDPAAGRWTRTGDLHQARRGNATVLLADGRVLTAGGVAGSQVLASAEIYDPATGQWSEAAPMHQARLNFTLTLLVDGRVLAAGGTGPGGVASLATAEIFDPRAGTWTPVPTPMLAPRQDAAAVLLRDGRVLIAGGANTSGGTTQVLDSAELFDPAGTVFTRAGSMSQPREDFTLTPLGDGRVLAAGGSASGTTLASAELFDPRTGTWTPTKPMAHPRRLQSASVLPNGTVLAVGGEVVVSGSRTSLTSAELYDPRSGDWRPARDMRCPRSAQAQVTLANGKVLVIGGDAAFPGQPPRAQSCVELFDLGTATPS